MREGKLIDPKRIGDVGRRRRFAESTRPAARTSLSAAAAHRLAGARRGVAGLGPGPAVTLARDCIEDVGSRRQLSQAVRETRVCG
ncbi:hypothetical protein MRX96_018234 [Rhipicephalus microplus]